MKNIVKLAQYTSIKIMFPKNKIVAIVLGLFVIVGAVFFYTNSVHKKVGPGENIPIDTGPQTNYYNSTIPGELADKFEKIGADSKTLRYISPQNPYYKRDSQNVYFAFLSLNPRKVEGADPDTFGIWGGGESTIGRDKDHIFFTGEIVLNADPNTFGPVEGGNKWLSGGPYFKDHDTVFYSVVVNNMTDYHYRLIEVIGADAKTIRIPPLSEVSLARDDFNLYLNGKIVPNIDGKTLMLSTSSPYISDKNGTYFFNNTFGKESFAFIDPSPIVKIFTNDFGLGGYVSIGDKMFFGTTTIPGADPKTFSIFEAYSKQGDGTHTECRYRNYCLYAKDGSSVYYRGKKIGGADPKTFVLLGYGLLNGAGKDPGESQPEYASDGKYVYYKDKIVQGADPNTFTPVVSGGYYFEYGKDSKNVYWGEKKIEQADPKTFAPVGHQQPYEGCGAGSYGIDEKGAYFENKAIIGADPKTFKPVMGSGSYAEDANHFYKNEKPVDRKEFEECNYG